MSKEPIADAMADCVFPEDIMLCILTRLPVKSLLRFKSVCKPWCELFTTRKFQKMHHDQFSRVPKNQAFITYGLFDGDKKTMSLFSIESNANKPRNLDLPYHGSFHVMYSVGCCHGLVCMSFLEVSSKPFTFDVGIALWNPALRLSKLVRFLKADVRVVANISHGFGYDAEGDDFRVVIIVTLKRKINMEVLVYVYSVKSNSFKYINLPFQFRVLHVKNDAIVNGNPYWVAKLDDNESLGEVLVCCDVTKLELKMVPLSTLKLEEGAKVPFVDWKGSLAALVCTKSKDRLESLDVWVFDDGEMIWRKNHTFGPLEMRVNRCLQCSKNGRIMVDCLDGKLFVFDPETGWVKEIEVSEGQKNTSKIYAYSESLAYIEGMEQMMVKKEEEEVEDDK